MKRITIITCALVWGLLGHALAGDDAPVDAKASATIQQAMKAHVEESQVGGTFYLYDAVADAVLKLKFKEMHAGVAKKGQFYVSCVDFTDGSKTYDVDFLVVEKDGAYKVVDTIVHQAGGEKRAYTIEK